MDEIRHIQERFPDRKNQIKRLIVDLPRFRDLCRDYGKCIEALAYWSKSSEPEAPERIKEYQGLVSSLENEVIEHLDRPDSFLMAKR